MIPMISYGADIAPLDLVLYEAAPQPSFNALDVEAVWDGENRGIDEFIDEMFDPLIATAGGYVTRSVLGKDASNTYDILEYDFNPAGATQTILLSFGMHGRETVPVYSAYRLAHYLINDPDVHPYFRYLRDNVRIKMIPSLGIWAGSQSPKVYANANNLNINRNFPSHREYISNDPSQTTSYRGPAPYSEAESVILRDWLVANLDASFYADWHTDYSFHGQTPTRDIWTFRSEFDPYATPILDRMADLLGFRALLSKGVSVLSVTKEDGAQRSAAKKYATEVLGVPAFTAEYAETRYGGRFGGHQDITNHLTMMVNFITTLCRANIRQQIIADSAAITSFITDYHFPPTNMFNDKVNHNWGIVEHYDAIDTLVAENPSYASLENLGLDASGTHQVKALTLDPGSATQTFCLIGGKDGEDRIETPLLLRLAQFLCNEASSHGYDDVRDTVKFMIIPTMNPWGYNANAVDLDTVELSFSALSGAIVGSNMNSNGVIPSRDLVSPTAAEAVAVKDFLTASVPTTAFVLGLGSSSSDANAINVRRHVSAEATLANAAIALGNTLLATRVPRSSSASVTFNDNVGANAAMADGLHTIGYAKSATINLGRSAFRVDGQDFMANNRPTAQAYLAYLLDLIRAVTT